MAFYSGQNGRMTIKEGSKFVKLAKVTNWQLSTTMQGLRTTTLEDTDSTFANGLRTTTGRCRLFYYDDNNSNSCSTLIKKLIKARSPKSDPGIAASPGKRCVSAAGR